MSAWCMAHPWMTFFLAAMAIYSLDCLLVNICKVVSAWSKKP